MRPADGIDRVLGGVTALALLLALAAYVALIGAGHWGSDEYFIGASNMQSGWRSALARTLHWSPRPVSELVSGLYLQLCQRLRRPLVIPFLGLLWLGAATLLALAARRAGEPRPIRVALLLLVLTLLLERPDEMFYWPMASVAYLVGWAGLGAATLLRRSAAPAGPRLPIALLLAAWSVEMAASVVLADAVLSTLSAAPGTRRRVARASLLPGLAAASVCLAVYLGRMRPMIEVLDPGSGLAGHWLRCIAMAVPMFWHELWGVPGLTALAAPAVKLAILLALPPPPAGCASARSRAVWAACLLLGAFLSIVLSLQQFGMPCCQRHRTMRQGMIVLALVCLAPPGRLAWHWRQAALAAALVFLLAVRIPDLRADLALLPRELAARAATWTSARLPGDRMVFQVAPAGRLFGGQTWPLGTATWQRGQAPRYGREAIAAFFDKRVITVMQR